MVVAEPSQQSETQAPGSVIAVRTHPVEAHGTARGFANGTGMEAKYYQVHH